MYIIHVLKDCQSNITFSKCFVSHMHVAKNLALRKLNQDTLLYLNPGYSGLPRELKSSYGNKTSLQALDFFCSNAYKPEVIRDNYMYMRQQVRKKT